MPRSFLTLLLLLPACASPTLRTTGQQPAPDPETRTEPDKTTRLEEQVYASTKEQPPAQEQTRSPARVREGRLALDFIDPTAEQSENGILGIVRLRVRAPIPLKRVRGRLTFDSKRPKDALVLELEQKSIGKLPLSNLDRDGDFVFDNLSTPLKAGTHELRFRLKHGIIEPATLRFDSAEYDSGMIGRPHTFSSSPRG